MIQTIDVGFNTVDKILHVADIHIRNYQRHKEYREVFKHLYKELKNYQKIVSYILQEI